MKKTKKKPVTIYLVSGDRKMPFRIEGEMLTKKEKPVRLSKAQKKRIKEIVGSGLNIEAILIGTEKRILESGEFPGLAEDIKIRRRHEPQKRLFKKEAAYISE